MNKAFDTIVTVFTGPVAQLGERRVRNAEVVGSIPIRSTIENCSFLGSNQAQRLSIPIRSTIKKPQPKRRLFSPSHFTFIFIFMLLPLIAFGQSYTGPLFDAHAHVKPMGAGMTNPMGHRSGYGAPDDDGASQANLMDAERRAGIKGAFLFGQEQLTLAEQARNPAFVFPFVNIPMDHETHQLLLTEDTLAQIETQLKTGHMFGIGEMSLRHAPLIKKGLPETRHPADGPIALKIYQLAAKYHVPVNIHFEHEYVDELYRALAQSPSSTIIWAHCGDAPASLVAAAMRKYPNLYADLSCRNPILRDNPKKQLSLSNDDERILPEWKALLIEFPDRFLLGFDLWVPDRIGYLDELVAYDRNVLGQLPLPVAEKIAFRNAEKLIEIKP